MHPPEGKRKIPETFVVSGNFCIFAAKIYIHLTTITVNLIRKAVSLLLKWILRQIHIARPLHVSHLGVCLTIALLGGLLLFISEAISLFDPIKVAFDDFYMSDIYYELLHTDKPAIDNDIVIVDMTELQAREDIARVISDIKECHPKVLCVDLIFERRSFDHTSDEALINAIESGSCRQLYSCKLRDYNPEKEAFSDCLYSFFSDIDSLDWGYTNYLQVRMGGCTRETSQHQKVNSQTLYSLPYLAACIFADKEPQEAQVNERKIMYEDVDFNIVSCGKVRQEADKLKDKVVILGTIAEEADMHFTPLGKMAGVKVLAYSARTYMKGNEIKEINRLVGLLIALVVCWFAAFMDYWIEQRHPVLFPILAKIFNFLVVICLIWFALELYTKLYYNLDLLYPLLGLALVEDVREMYSGFIKWLQEKTHWKILERSLYAKKRLHQE